MGQQTQQVVSVPSCLGGSTERNGQSASNNNKQLDQATHLHVFKARLHTAQHLFCNARVSATEAASRCRAQE